MAQRSDDSVAGVIPKLGASDVAVVAGDGIAVALFCCGFGHHENMVPEADRGLSGGSISPERGGDTGGI